MWSLRIFLSSLTNRTFCTLRSKNKRICQGVPISYSLGEETGRTCVSTSQLANDDSWYACFFLFFLFFFEGGTRSFVGILAAPFRPL